jgi:hypothetical protein
LLVFEGREIPVQVGVDECHMIDLCMYARRIDSFYQSKGSEEEIALMPWIQESVLRSTRTEDTTKNGISIGRLATKRSARSSLAVPTEPWYSM